MLKNGINPNGYRDSFLEETYIFLAIRTGNLSGVEMLLEYKADLNVKNFLKKTPLHEAIRYKKWDIAALIIKTSPATIHALNKENKTPLDYVEDKALKEKFLLLVKPQEAEQNTAKEDKKSSRPSLAGLMSPKKRDCLIADAVSAELSESKQCRL